MERDDQREQLDGERRPARTTRWREKTSKKKLDGERRPARTTRWRDETSENN